MLFLCYPKCTTCQKAKAWLEEQKADYTLRDIKQENPSLEELQQLTKEVLGNFSLTDEQKDAYGIQ